jgi:hypothetical protein
MPKQAVEADRADRQIIIRRRMTKPVGWTLTNLSLPNKLGAEAPGSVKR